MNDALGAIERDPEFGKKLSRAASMAFDDGPHDVSAGNHGNAATVLGSHHAYGTVLFAVGGNSGTKLHHSFGISHHDQAQQERLCREWADKLGFRLVRKPAKD